ncbi:hypothetical protein BC828DRAFT_384765 [Blastocladiella britannica]|nr:hypothetical protein BC828DRAFT_384765 [Blastocladiella britannica]
MSDTETSSNSKTPFIDQDALTEPITSFAKQSQLFMNRCTKPSQKEFWRIFQVVGVGFLIMGFIGFVVKLVHIPINNIIVGATA